MKGGRNSKGSLKFKVTFILRRLCETGHLPESVKNLTCLLKREF